jgi:hypothetical protein
VILAVLETFYSCNSKSTGHANRNTYGYDDIDCRSVEMNGLPGNLQPVAGFPEVVSVTLPVLYSPSHSHS